MYFKCGRQTTLNRSSVGGAGTWDDRPTSQRLIFNKKISADSRCGEQNTYMERLKLNNSYDITKDGNSSGNYFKLK